MSSMFPNSAIGLPQSLEYILQPNLSNSSYSVNVALDGVTSVALPATAFVANSIGLFGNVTFLFGSLYPVGIHDDHALRYS